LRLRVSDVLYLPKFGTSLIKLRDACSNLTIVFPYGWALHRLVPQVMSFSIVLVIILVVLII
jgi:hypothetical protein